MSERPALIKRDHLGQTCQRFRKLLDLLGLSYVDAAKLMGVSKGTLNHYLAGTSYPQPYALYLLCRSRNVDFNYVFLGDWSALPAAQVRALDAELQASLAAIPELDPKAPENSAPAKPKKSPATKKRTSKASVS